MKRIVVYTLSALSFSIMVAIGLNGCGGSSTKQPLNPAGTYSVTYSPSSFTFNCTFTANNTGATAVTPTTVQTTASTMTITSSPFNYIDNGICEGAACSGSANFTCDPDSCKGSVNLTANLQDSDGSGGYWTASMSVVENNIVITSNSINGAITLSDLNMSDSNLNYTASCTPSPNTINFSGSKQ